MSEVIIQTQNLKKSYRLDKKAAPIPVLNGINIEVNKGDFAIIYGPSGSGKSTLLHHLAGLELPTEGKIWVGNQDLTLLNDEKRAIFRSAHFGMVYQLPYWVKSLLVWENVALPLYILGFEARQAKTNALKTLELIGLTEYAYKKPTQLSGGEQQRVGLARAIVNNPSIVIADEPTGNLDTASADKVMGFLQDLSYKQKKTLIMVTHNLAYLPMANRTIAMKDGLVTSSDIKGLKEEITQELKGVA